MLEKIASLIPVEYQHSIKALSDDAVEKMQVDNYNSRDGGASDLYNCPICRNKQMVAYLHSEYHDFTLKECECVKIRKNLVNIRKSGLTDELLAKKFSTYNTREKWQEAIKMTAFRYLENNNGKWLYIGGQSGSGKTHLCTAVCNEFLNHGRTVKYILWRMIVQKLSANRFSENYQNIIDDIADADVIYIDDFLKSTKPINEIDFAFELINIADIRKKQLIISSELLLDDIYKLDESMSGRIAEHSGDFVIQIPKNSSRNYRLKG